MGLAMTVNKHRHLSSDAFREATQCDNSIALDLLVQHRPLLQRRDLLPQTSRVVNGQQVLTGQCQAVVAMVVLLPGHLLMEKVAEYRQRAATAATAFAHWDQSSQQWALVKQCHPHALML